MALRALLLLTQEGLNFTFGNSRNYKFLKMYELAFARSRLYKNYPKQNKCIMHPRYLINYFEMGRN